MYKFYQNYSIGISSVESFNNLYLLFQEQNEKQTNMVTLKTNAELICRIQETCWTTIEFSALKKQFNRVMRQITLF